METSFFMERLIYEKTSVDVKILSNFREVMTYPPKEGAQKNVVSFLASPQNIDFAPQQGKIAQVSWINTYNNDKQALCQSRNCDPRHDLNMKGSF